MTLIATIDAGACAAHGDCEAIAPEIFAIDDVAVVVGTGPDDLMLAAAQACPSVAIVVTDADGRRSTRSGWFRTPSAHAGRTKPRGARRGGRRAR